MIRLGPTIDRSGDMWGLAAFAGIALLLIIVFAVVHHLQRRRKRYEYYFDRPAKTKG